MKARKFVTGVGEFFDFMGSAMAVSAAVRNRQPARAADLQRLGIDPEQFSRIRRY